MDFQYTIPLIAKFLLTSTCVVMSQVYEPKTLVSNYCPEVTNSMLQEGLDYAATVYRYDLIKPAVIELTSLQALLLSLLNCLKSQDMESCSILANCSNRIQQIRSRNVGLWLREDFTFPEKDMKVAMARLDNLVAGGAMVLDSKVSTVFSSLAKKYGITLLSKVKSSDLPLELENAVANDIPCEIIDLANEGANVNGLTQSGGRFIHLAVRSVRTSSIAALGFLKADLEVLNAAGATPMEEAIEMDRVPSIKGLILAGANITKRLLGGNSYLHIAASSGKNRALETLLKAGLGPDLRNHLGETSLQLAVKGGNVKGVEILMERCANSSSILEEGKNFLHKAVVSSNVDMFKAYIKCSSLLDLRFENNDTLVHLIVRSNNATKILKVLEGRRVPLNIKNNDGLAPLHIVTDPSVVEALLELGADINITTGKGETALQIALGTEHLNVAKVLFKHGVGVNKIYNYGETALMVAAKSKKNIIVKFLLNSGADIKLKDEEGRTALHFASDEGCTDCASTLLDKGAKVDERDASEFTSLHYAARKGQAGMANLLLERGAVLSARTNTGWTPLMVASHHGRLDIVKLLIDRGSAVNDIDAYRYTALHHAARKGQIGVVNLLLENGADLKVKSFFIGTPLIVAAADCRLDVVKLLIARGARINDKDMSGYTALQYSKKCGKELSDYIKSKGGVE